MISLVSVGPLVLFICYLLSIAVYNVFFHPLRNFPGPKLNAVTKLPYINALLRGQGPFYIQSLHEKYGDVVRINTNELSYTNAAAWRDIYGAKPAGQESFEKDLSVIGPDIVGKNGLARAMGDANHARQRKIFSYAFSDRALREQEPLLRGYVNKLTENIEQLVNANEKVGISDLFNFITFDIMGDLAFGENLGLLQNNNYTPWVKAVFDNIKLSMLGHILRMYPTLGKLFQFFLPKHLKEQRRKQIMYTIESVDRRLAKKTDRPDIWTYVLKYQAMEDEKQRITLPEMHSTASTLMMAGSETTATLLSGLTYLLLKNPKTLSKLCAEIRGTFKSINEIDMPSLARLEYLNACLDEALRIYPPIPAGLPRLVPAKGAVVAGRPVPGGTTVSVPNFAANHSKANFTRPEEFLPERWLPDAGEEFAADVRAAAQPFSTGPRNCLGKNLAYHEMRLVMANLLYRFELEELSEGCEDWINQRVFTFWEKPVLMVRLKQRV